MDNQAKDLAVFCALFYLAGCQGVQFQSNVTPEYVGDTLKATKVVEYSVEDIYSFDSQMIGDVASSYCQKAPNSPKPGYSMLLRDLKYKVQQLGGNGVVIMECTKQDPFAECSYFLECRALAYKINFS
ncbi:hypothetical protein CXF86_16420 [Shewanella sp. GutCb]|jgi:hypothetical protein|uniref:hypothetical protein n=1 Tax=Shewanella sp. GutCb TaxID=2058315 RepID=UPI000C7B0F83|nr:hypothetical protein [Shewanella sp. GutCb]PKG73564.1 hypothetical protein CXF86_16420 [Shewanella sp. GutCb]